MASAATDIENVLASVVGISLAGSAETAETVGTGDKAAAEKGWGYEEVAVGRGYELVGDGAAGAAGDKAHSGHKQLVPDDPLVVVSCRTLVPPSCGHHRCSWLYWSYHPSHRLQTVLLPHEQGS